MIDLFSRDGAVALAALARRRALYAFDFDGTLSPIVARPDDARAARSTVELLRTLGQRVPTVLLTGRGVDDLERRIDFEPRYRIGNHGAEGLPGGSDEEALAAHRAVVREWLSQWPAAIGHWNGDHAHLVVEPKTFSLSLHYRAAPDHEAARRAIDGAVRRLVPAPRVIGGKCVINLLPDGAPDKGVALAALVRFEKAEAAFFIGDDITDESVFAMAPESWVTVRVGRSDESAARYAIDDQGDIDRCLGSLISSVLNAGSGSLAR